MNDQPVPSPRLKFLTEEYGKLATALHAGVKVVNGYDASPLDPLNLKVAILMNTATINSLVSLCERKGLFDRHQFMETVVASLTNEVIKYENILTERFGKTAEGEGVKLGYRNAKPE